MDVDSKMKLQQYSLVLGTFLEIGVILAESVIPLTSKSLTQFSPSIPCFTKTSDVEYCKDPAEKICHLKQFSAGHKAARVNTVCDCPNNDNTIDLKSYAGVKKFT